MRLRGDTALTLFVVTVLHVIVMKNYVFLVMKKAGGAIVIEMLAVLVIIVLFMMALTVNAKSAFLLVIPAV